MDFDELIENKNKCHGKNKKHHYHDENDNTQHGYYSRKKYSGKINFIDILQSTENNKMYKFYTILIFFLILIFILILLIVAFPIIMKLYNSISENGSLGIMNEINVFI